jgi:SAM-dependent methyltransferase
VAVQMNEAAYHTTRLAHDRKREVLWAALCEYYFSKFIRPEFHVLDLGAGYADFINNVHCASRTAVDLWPLMPSYAASGVVARVGSVTDLSFLPDASVDLAFASNLFEHLTKVDFAMALAQLRQKLKPDGTLMILQPNYRLAYKEYFDDYTHVSVFSGVSLCDFLAAHGFRILEFSAGFLPLSVKSKLPVSRALIRLYLASPWKPVARQMLVRAKIDSTGSASP